MPISRSLVAIAFATWYVIVGLEVAGCGIHSAIRLSKVEYCPSNGLPPTQSAEQLSRQQCAMLCVRQPWCAALTFANPIASDIAGSGTCRLFTAETVLLAWNASCASASGQSAIAMASSERLAAFHTEYLAARNVTRKPLHIPYNSAKILAAWTQPQPEAASLIGCVAKCAGVPACRGVLYNSSSCSLLTDHPLCRWFQLPPNASQLAVSEFYSVNSSQCFETVILRVSNQVDFDRLWTDYKTGFGTYHSDYFVGLEWLHSQTSAQPSSNRLRVDLLYWDETYIYAYYLNVLILAESTNYTVATATYVNAGGLGNCLFAAMNVQFVTRDRGSADCAINCTITYQPQWHWCCHCGGPFGKYFNYPTALCVSAANRAKGIVWAPNAPANDTNGFFYSFKQLEILMLNC